MFKNCTVRYYLFFFFFVSPSSYLVMSSSHMYVLREIPRTKDKARVVGKRPLSSIAKITCKRKNRDLITFQYGGVQGDGLIISDYDR